MAPLRAVSFIHVLGAMPAQATPRPPDVSLKTREMQSAFSPSWLNVSATPPCSNHTQSGIHLSICLEGWLCQKWLAALVLTGSVCVRGKTLTCCCQARKKKQLHRKPLFRPFPR
jgi:hypothetical protein